MQQDKLFNVTLIGTRMLPIYGIVKAENMPEALMQCSREYPQHSVMAIEESIRTLL